MGTGVSRGLGDAHTFRAGADQGGRFYNIIVIALCSHDWTLLLPWAVVSR